MFLDEADINLEDIALDNNIPSNPGAVSIKGIPLYLYILNRNL